ncbi:MAG TPA: FtsW/RodA/SpoVE family cell cycle protein [Micropepsaceae bacterium]|jgi:cell division protein FtsW|nr:FtsW/RodA/SpoVE family cell cycle protein [Micropepsaceae bacterium]
MTLSRADNSGFARWWWTIDRVSLFAVLALLAIGQVLAFAASPAATGHGDAAGNFSYAVKQLAFAATAVCILLGASFLTFKQARLTAACVFALALIGAVLALLFGPNVNGAHRWLEMGGFKLEPSEFLKPAFAVLAAAFLADKLKRGFPGEAWTLGFLAPAILVLLFQPDVGQTALLTTLCVAMLFFAGLPYYWIAALGAGGAGLATAAYFLHSHVRERIAQFLDAGGYQTGLALKAFEAGGIAGVGPGAGTIKYRLPDAHTDFIFAVAGEEFGVVLCLLIAILFGVVTIRLLLRAARAREQFAQLAGAGLALAIGLQAFINMGVSLSVLPAKGMTLPLISYGGSSLFGVALTLGFALGLTRQRPVLPEEAAR